MRNESRELAEVPASGACAVCGVEFATDSEHAVEISFRIHPSVRNVPHRLYCSAEPSARPHIKVQQTLQAGERREVETRLPDGAYRIRIRGRTGAERLDVVASERERVCHWLDMEIQGVDAARVGPSPTLILENPADEAQTFIVETPVWSDGVLEPGDLFSLQEFRELFPEQRLAPGVRLFAGDQTILYLDMVRPVTRFAARDDADGRDELSVLHADIAEMVKRSRGAVIRTTGDAITAAFASPIDALQAAGAILERHAIPGDDELRLRASANRGPCLAVNVDNQIDYFGTAVSLAARLQTAAGAGQVAFPEALRQAPGVATYLEKTGAQLALVSFEAPGLERPIPAYVWDPVIAAS
jgi:class 3 adenylate cyclase